MTEHHSLYARRDRLAGGLQGLLIGDALGVPYEFHDAAALPPSGAIDMQPPAGFARSHAGILPGTWSDDGAQALCLLQSLTACAGLDIGDFSRRLVNWADRGYLAVDGKVFDIGIQTARAVAALRSGTPPHQAGPRGEYDNGNGSLMRVLPLALWHVGDDEAVIAMAAQQSLPTHGHPRSQVACAMFCLWARAELNGNDSAWEHAEIALRRLGPDAGLPVDEIELVLAPVHRTQAAGSGYVVDTLWSARVAMDQTIDYESAVRRAIAFGQDTDTTAAVTGGIAGIRYGLHGIPERWLQQLRGQELLKALQAALLAHAARQENAVEDILRTSQTHPLQIGTLDLANNGKIGVTFCPGKNQTTGMTGRWVRDLDTDLAAIRAWGASHLVTLIENEEFVELDVIELPERAKAHGLIWHHAPIRDGGVPDQRFEQAWQRIKPALLEALEHGEGVVVHCKGGLGRAGTVASLLLAAHEPTLAIGDVINAIRQARPNAIETVAQERYLRRSRQG